MSNARLVLENGHIYKGKVFSKGHSSFGELIFNTAMSGYEEVLTDPSYSGQIVLMTYPLIGNYGINEEDKQSRQLHLQSLVVKEYIDFPSNWRSKYTLKEYLEKHNILGIEGIDTRHITRRLRHVGSLNALVTDSDEPDHILIQKVKEFKGITGKNLAKIVSTKSPYNWDCPDKPSYSIAVIDCGVKFSILNQLKNKGCKVTVFPYDTPASELLNQEFDGVLVSNGPGDPSSVTSTIKTIQEIAGKIPIFGICLGHQMICHAFGFEMVKLAFGHHGANHPIKNLYTGLVEISSQNHIYCATDSVIPRDFSISHVNLNDNTVAGIRSDKNLIFSVQYHPEAAPGPNDSHYLFDDFLHLIKHKEFKTKKTSVKENYAKAN
ncbi:carbamoyl phosphate synthase small subunit [Candidatus Marinamargulisbacteria bacterium SCGC AG-343-D04]|nr:carbamoyl phosphate synthase small subunit [Candidatus Marinamargulisbacteria bacterium SCGC AG-343-D04]